MGKITYQDGNIFDSDAKIICHQVNTYGVMGAGIAAEVKERFPEVYTEYNAFVLPTTRISCRERCCFPLRRKDLSQTASVRRA